MSLSTIDQSTGNATVISGNVNDKVGNLAALTTTDKSSCVGAINEVKSGLNSVPIIKTFEISVSAGTTSVNFSNSRPADFLHAICASSRTGGGAIITQLNDIYIYFSGTVPSDAILQIVYLARA